jgi:predicted transposase/invertase (TIGR01784 family)
LNDIFKDMDTNARRRKDFRLPAVVPIILYDGERQWTAVRSFKEYTKDYEIFGNNIIDFEYLLLDLNRTDDSAILPVQKLLDAAFSLTKKRKTLSPKELVEWCAEQVPHLSKDDKHELVDWVMFASGTSQEIKKTLQDIIMKGDAVAMKTGFDWLVEDARSEGVLVGKREGKSEGKREGERKKALEIADRLMAKGMSIGDVADATGLTVNEILQR